MSIVATLGALLSVFVLLTKVDAGAQPWTVDVYGATVIGGATVVLHLEGELATGAGAAPCAGGELNAGTLSVADGDTTMTAVLTYGLATAGCVPGYPDGVYVDARGYWETASTQQFSLTMIGIRGSGGQINAVVGDILTQTFGRRRGEPEALSVFTGRFRGTGEWSGLGGAGAASDSRFVDALRAGLPAAPDATLDTAGGPPVRGKPFTLQLTTNLDLGKGKVELTARGRVTGGSKDCASGQITAGTLTITDADDRLLATVTHGYVTNCGRGKEAPRGLQGEVSGIMRDSRETPFSLSLNGKPAVGGRYALGTMVLAASQSREPIGKGVDAGSVLDEVDTLRSKVTSYLGTVSGGFAKPVGLVPPDRPDPQPQGRRFTLKISGHDGEHIVLTAEGNYYVGYPGPRDVYFAGRQQLQVMVGETAYDIQVNQFYLRREGASGGRLYILGALKASKAEEGEPPPPAGFIIAELDVSGMPFALFAEGGKATVSGRIAALRVGAKTYRPEVTGTLATQAR